MNLLVVHPGASVSTHDVCVGLSEALRERGHKIWDYALDGRIERAGQYLNYCWQRSAMALKKAKQPLLQRPSAADIQYKAGEELVARALRVHREDDPLDWVIVVSGMYLHPDIFVLLRRAGLRVAILFTESPYDDERQVRLLPWVTWAWTNERSTAREWGIGYLPHALRDTLHRTDTPVSADTPAHDVVIVGTGFQERIELLSAVDWTGVDLALYGAWTDLVDRRHKLRPYVKGDYIRNEHATALYRRAKVGLNIYRESMGFGRDAPRVAHAESLNPRAYELAATGCFTLSTRRQEVSEVFGDLVPTFGTAEELGALVRQWLRDDVGRERIRAALPAAVASHTWDVRAAQVESDLQRVGTVAASAASRGAVSVAGG